MDTNVHMETADSWGAKQRNTILVLGNDADVKLVREAAPTFQVEQVATVTKAGERIKEDDVGGIVIRNEPELVKTILQGETGPLKLTADQALLPILHHSAQTAGVERWLTRARCSLTGLVQFPSSSRVPLTTSSHEPVMPKDVTKFAQTINEANQIGRDNLFAKKRLALLAEVN